MAQQAVDQRPQPAAGDRLAAVVDRHHPVRVQRLGALAEHLVALRRDLRPDRPAPLAPHRDHRARRQLLDQVALVEPDHQARPRVVVHAGLDDRQVAAAGRPHADRIDRADDRRLLARAQVGDAHRVPVVLVAEGDVLEHVAHRAQRARTHRGEARAQPLVARRRLLEVRRARCGRRLGRRPVERRAGEAAERHSPASTAMPTVPGPPCVPTTAPSSSTWSTDAAGRARAIISWSDSTAAGLRAWHSAIRPGCSLGQVLAEVALERGQDTRRAAHPAVRGHLAVLQRQQRAHPQQPADRRLGTADAAALAQELQRLHAEQQRQPRLRLLEPGHQRILGHPADEQPLKPVGQQQRRAPTPPGSRARRSAHRPGRARGRRARRCGTSPTPRTRSAARRSGCSRPAPRTPPGTRRAPARRSAAGRPRSGSRR